MTTNTLEPAATKMARGGRLVRWLGNACIGLGLILLTGVAAAFGYGQWEQQQALEAFRREEAARAAQAPARPTARPAPPAPAPSAAPEPGPLEPSTAPAPVGDPLPAVVPTATLPLDLLPSPPPMPAAMVDYAEPIRLVIPSIQLDSRVVQVGIVDGEFEVPKFLVGHYIGSANVGEPGNSVMAGHVSSISSGNVFANLESVKPGDEVYVYGESGPLIYRVTETRVVQNTEVSVMAPTPDPTLTLITCTGDWDWIAREYTHRFVVFAALDDANTVPQLVP